MERLVIASIKLHIATKSYVQMLTETALSYISLVNVVSMLQQQGRRTNVEYTPFTMGHQLSPSELILSCVRLRCHPDPPLRWFIGDVTRQC